MKNPGYLRSFEAASGAYARVVGALVRRTAIAVVVYALLIGLTFFEFRSVPGGFIPAQDMGYLIAVVQLPYGSSLERTDTVVRKVIAIAGKTPGVGRTIAFAGFNGATRVASPSAGAVFVPLEPFEERSSAGSTAAKIQAELQRALAAIPQATIFVINPPPVQGLGTAGGFKFLVQDRAGRPARALQEMTDDLIAAARQEPSLTGVFTTYRASVPQLFADIDRVKANMLNVPLANVFEVLQVGLGSICVNDYNALGGVWARGMDNNLITQIGFVVLIGLAAKNAVLIVEFAEQREHAGEDRFTAAIEACRLRLRPIIMTSFAFILGVVPMAIASGPGAEMRQVLDTAVFAGMLGVTFFGLLLTPAFFVSIRGFAKPHTAQRESGTPHA